MRKAEFLAQGEVRYFQSNPGLKEGTVAGSGFSAYTS